MSEFAYLGFDRDELRLLCFMLKREGQGVHLNESSRLRVKGISKRADDAFKASVVSESLQGDLLERGGKIVRSGGAKTPPAFKLAKPTKKKIISGVSCPA